MNHLVDVEFKINSQDPVTGENLVTWSPFKENVPCSIDALSVKDYVQSRADQSEIRVRIKLPYFPGFDSTMRIVGLCGCHLNKIYNPEAFLEDNITSQEYFTVPCSLGVNEG